MNAKDYTAAQLAAIETNAPEVLCVAGPGAGKTRTLIGRTRRIIGEGTQPDRIILTTFTNSAAKEIAERLPKLGGCDDCDPCLGGRPDQCAVNPATPIKLGHLGTVHSFCLRMMKEYGEPFGYGEGVAVISPESAADLIQSKAKTLNCKTPIKTLLKIKGAGQAERGLQMSLEEVVICSYFDDLRGAGIVDYDAILSEFLRMLTSSTIETEILRGKLRARFEHLLVDEVQDSSPIDWQIYRALPIANKFFVGDSDQAIFGFRGGSVRETVHYAQMFGVQVIRLDDNFRSRSEICGGANRLIAHNVNRIHKDTLSVSGDGGMIIEMSPCANEGEEIGQVARTILSMTAHAANPSIAIISRTNAVADGFRKTLPHSRIPLVERSVSELPRDWSFARSFIELLIRPENDALAFFHLVALYEKRGASPFDARKQAHDKRNRAQAEGRTLNEAEIGLTRVSRPEIALQALAGSGASKEAVAVALDKYHELPAGATVLDLALSLGEVKERISEGTGEGVQCLTIHGAKGREFDVVFLVGFEDESCPGRAAKSEKLEDMEEERRLAFVAITRARERVYLCHSTSRVTPWGQTTVRKPSRFIAEILEGVK